MLNEKGIDYEIHEMTRRMNAHRKTAKKNIYENIAREWLRENLINLADMSYCRDAVKMKRNERCIPVTDLERVFRHRYIDGDGKPQSWFTWLSKEFPLWNVRVKGKPGRRNGNAPGFHSIGSLRRGALRKSGELLKSMAPHSMHPHYMLRIDLAMAKMEKAFPDEKFSIFRQRFDPASARECADHHPDRKSRELAKRILLFSHEDCWFPVMERSVKGRTYHRGMNLQTLPSDLRGMLLGPHMRVDAKVCSWRFFHSEYGKAGGKSEVLNRMLSDRKSFREMISMDVCGDASEESIACAKRALTSIPFGIGLSDMRTTKLHDVLRDAAEVKKFMEHPDVIELKKVRDELLDGARKKWKRERRSMDFFEGEHPSPARMLNCFYNEYEKSMRERMMRIAESAFGRGSVLLQVHDGIFIDIGARRPDKAIQRANSLFIPSRFKRTGQEFDIEFIDSCPLAKISDHYPEILPMESMCFESGKDLNTWEENNHAIGVGINAGAAGKPE